MADDMLSLGGDDPLVFGIQCPWCDSTHLVVSLGANPVTPEGEDIEVAPTLGLIGIDEETEIGVVKCWHCFRVFRFHFCVIVPEDEMMNEPMN